MRSRCHTGACPTLIHPGVEGFVRLRPDQIFMVDEFTAPPFRRRGITRRMAAAMAPALVARGFREVVGIHRVDNHDTIAAVEAKGIPRVGTVTRWCVPWHVWFTFEAAPSRPTAMPVAILRVPLATTGPAPLTEPASTVSTV